MRVVVFRLTRGSRRSTSLELHQKRLRIKAMMIKAMEKDSKTPLKSLQVDGGASNNDFLMQFQSDVLGVEVMRPIVSETTALGAAYLAGLATGFFKDKKEIKEKHRYARTWEPDMSEEKEKA